MEYDFTFAVSGVDVDDRAAVETLRRHRDALLARAGGVDLLCVTGSGGSVAEAASAVRAAVPRLRVIRLDRDPVDGRGCVAHRSDGAPVHLTPSEAAETDAGLAAP
ncbi:hypothetical protein AB0A99_23520 [Streptomyces fradiae]|uniref:hypothetical protein n=1 Tax=Streptomyces fradiae TaxID=1906 RepID=UPI0033E33E48